MPSIRRHVYVHNNLICTSDILRSIEALYGHHFTLGDAAVLVFIETLVSYGIITCKKEYTMVVIKPVLLRDNYSIMKSSTSYMCDWYCIHPWRICS